MDLKPLAVCLLPLAISFAVAEMPPGQVASGDQYGQPLHPKGVGAPATSQSTVTVPDVSAVSPDRAILEEGKALYENGQFIAALGKFMTVLRKDPHNPEARQYLRMVIDVM